LAFKLGHYQGEIPYHAQDATCDGCGCPTQPLEDRGLDLAFKLGHYQGEYPLCRDGTLTFCNASTS